MLSDDKHCEMLTNQIRDRNGYILEAFKLFVQMFSAIVGGTIVLRLQYKSAKPPNLSLVPPSFTWLVDGLALLVVVVCTIMILEHFRGWYQYRKRLSDVAGTDASGKRTIPLPRLRAGLVELTMIVVMWGAWALFHFYNPLRT